MKSLSFLTLVCCASLSGFALEGQARELKLGHNMTEEQAVHKGMLVFADLLKEKSNGTLSVKVFPNGQLGSERDQAEQVITGALDMAKINGSLAESFEPNLAVLSVPFLFRDEEHMKNFMRSPVARELLESSRGKGFIGLTMYDAGSRSFYAKKPILKPEDLTGLKMRVPESKMMMNMVSLLGGQPTPMSWSEIYTGLQQGIIDGAENSVSSIVEMRHAEISNHYSKDEHTMTPDIVFISEDVWDSLSAQEQAWVREAVEISLEEQITLWEAGEKANVEKARKMGVTFHDVDKAAFREKTQPIIEEMMKNPVLADFLAKINKIQ